MNRANITLAAAATGCVIAGGALLAVAEHLPFGDGLFCSVGTATTAGCNTSAPAAAQVVSVLLMLTAIPLLGALFARLTAHHASVRIREHLRDSEKRIKQHLEDRLAEHHKAISEAAQSPAPRRRQDSKAASERNAAKEDGGPGASAVNKVRAANAADEIRHAAEQASQQQKEPR